MANDYPKINTLFLRDENNIIMPDSFTCPEFRYLKNCPWECTEKIDGTNIHLDYTVRLSYSDTGEVTGRYMATQICGRTSKANIPKHLYDKLCTLFLYDIIDGHEVTYEKIDTFFAAFEEPIGKAIKARANELYISLYGEGYGAKIQSGGRYIRNDVGFILFDVKVNGWWLSRAACEKVAEKLDVPIVPLVGYMSIPEAIAYVKKGFKSNVSEDPDLEAEGLVLKTPDGLMLRNGQRIITKIKTCDFRKYRSRYGDSGAAQNVNPNYNKK